MIAEKGETFYNKEKQENFEKNKINFPKKLYKYYENKTINFKKSNRLKLKDELIEKYDKKIEKFFSDGDIPIHDDQKLNLSPNNDINLRTNTQYKFYNNIHINNI
jgi:hypothetical protein